MMWSVSGCVLERMLNASMGPAKSTSWNPGKMTAPIFDGKSVLVASGPLFEGLKYAMVWRL